MRPLSLLLLVLLAGCAGSTTTSSSAGGGPCTGLAASADAAACWVWSDSVARTALPDRNAPRRPLLLGSDGAVVMSAQPAP